MPGAVQKFMPAQKKLSASFKAGRKRKRQQTVCKKAKTTQPEGEETAGNCKT